MVIVNNYYVDKRLVSFWGKYNLEHMVKKDSDAVFLVDGRERGGKSTFAFQQACALEPSLLESPEKFCSRICFTAKEFNDVVRNTKNGVVIFDEAFRGLSSRAAMSKVNKGLIQTLMEMGQNNNIIFIILPSFFMLDIYPAMIRSDILFHIELSKNTGDRKFYGYNRRDKNSLYQLGLKKGWNYVIRSRFYGIFRGKFPGGDDFRKAYLAKKAKALQEMFKSEQHNLAAIDEDVVEIKKMREMGFTHEKIAAIKGMSRETVRRRLSKSLSLPPNMVTPIEPSVE